MAPDAASVPPGRIDAPITRAPLPTSVLDVPRNGIGAGRGRPGQRVIVLGGGIAGLVAAHELARAGHDPVVLEAQHRVGGRIYTKRDFAPGLYGEAGAMRIPRAHSLTLAYCELFGLQLRPFMMGNPLGLVHVFGQRMTMADAVADPDRLGFERLAAETKRTWDGMWEESTADLRAVLERDGEAGWDEIIGRYDRMSLFDFLVDHGWSEGAIEMYGVMNFVESDLHRGVVEELRETLGQAYVDMQEIVGGSDRLTDAFFHGLRDRIRLGAEVRRIAQDESSVTVTYRTTAGIQTISGDRCVCALPFSVLRSIEVTPAFGRPKQKAIRQLNYSASTKVLFQVRDRKWETLDGIHGGATVTDLSVRRLNYPTPDPDPTQRRGVLLASYTWGQDALRWDAMDEETRIEEALDDVEQIHPWIREEFEVGASHAWYDDKWARGAFAMFEPGQLTDFHHDIVRPEGRVHFAGEHASLHHAWIQGALDSGIRCAREINDSH